MRIVSLLILWSFPVLPMGGYGRTLSVELPPAAHVGHVKSVFLRDAGDQSLPWDLGAGNLSQSLAEDDDSLEDESLEVELSTTWRLLAFGRGNLSALAPLCDGLLRTPPYPHPLRC
jgi:hypothetical protein